MAELKTRPDLLAALRRATTREMSANEVYAQKVSFIMGSLDEKSSVTRSFVEKVLAKQEGRKAG